MNLYRVQYRIKDSDPFKIYVIQKQSRKNDNNYIPTWMIEIISASDTFYTFLSVSHKFPYPQRNVTSKFLVWILV